MRTLKARNESDARLELAAMEADGLLEYIFSIDHRQRVNALELNELLRKSKTHAAQRGIAFMLSRADIEAMYTTSAGRCAVSGLPFDQRYRAPGATKRPYAISLDRIDCARGYEPGNVRLVCALVNVAMGEWGEAALRRVAIAIVMRRK